MASPKDPRAAAEAAGARRAAILMVSLDQETAARLMAQLEKPEQERIATEIVRLDSAPPDRAEREKVLREFYTRLGFPEVKFRPSYYPYTEPSLDVAVRWNNRWLELGGAGIFRPEVSQPLGVPCPVLAWGLGLERLAMMRLGLKDIRDLYVPDLKWLQENPLRR